VIRCSTDGGAVAMVDPIKKAALPEKSGQLKPEGGPEGPPLHVD